MTRPRSTDLPVRLKAAEAALPVVADWLGTEYKKEHREEMLNQMADAFAISSDGYEICRRLEQRHGWYPDAQLVEIFDEQFLWDAESAAVAEWVKTADIQPEHKIGDQVSFNCHGGTWTAGIISDINLGMATYMVRLDHRDSFALIPFEAAKLLPPLEPASALSGDIPPDKADTTNT